MVEAVLTGMLIFFARVTDVSLGTMRMLMLVKGRRLQAAAFGFFEAMIYVVALSRVVTQLNRWEYVLVYALGFASGNFLGVFLEERMALGYAGVEIIVRSESDALVQKLREEGFGVTVGEGWGKEGPKDILTVILPRRQMPKLMELVRSHDNKAFTIVMDARKTLGGFYRRQKSK
ncbi:MAG: DUF2179 domain-containing protein [Firmicutes bacterium]|nr:DUF2179 domain-containing protein [Bacillota bacterium]HOB35547.1 DUF2179 domain-containing protein [Bacillota bacterium]HPZ90522.1 DUF2179 domain-containing protein [Bacillota bacterium]HQE02644.1 DUF2179 domain-containing protein [Bacillota bacterium]